MLKNLSIAKRKEVKTPSQPTHDIIAIDENYNKESRVTVGAMWTKVAQDQEGKDYKFLSGSLSKQRTGTDGKEYDGYVLITEKEYHEYQILKSVNVGVKVDDGSVKNVEDIPF